MTSISDILEKQIAVEASLNQKMLDFDNLLKSSCTSTSNLDTLMTEFREFKRQTQSIFQLLRQQISEVIGQVDAIEMRHRKKFLLLSGVAEKSDEITVDVVVNIIRDNLKLTSISAAVISSAYRLGKVIPDRPRPIIFRIAQASLREEIWQKKAMLKGTSIVLSEYLTKLRRALFMDARKHFNMRNVWTFDGVIYVKSADGKRYKIFTKQDLDVLLQKQSALINNSVSPDAAPTQPSTSCTANIYTRPRRNKNK